MSSLFNMWLHPLYDLIEQALVRPEEVRKQLWVFLSQIPLEVAIVFMGITPSQVRPN